MVFREFKMNQIYSRIKKSSAGLFIGGGLAFLLIAALIFIFVCSTFFKYFFADAPDLFSVPSSSYSTGDWYTCNNNILFDYYCSDEDGRYYVTATNDLEYFGFYVYKKDFDLADRITDGSYKFMNMETDAPPAEFISAKGYLQPMDPSEKRYFKQFFEHDDVTADDFDMKFYTFKPMTPWRALTDDNGDNNLFYFIVAIALAISGIFCIIHFITGGYKKSLKKSISTYGILPELLENDMNHAVNIQNAYIGSEHVLFAQAAGSKVIPYNALIWAYVMITTTKHTTYGIPTGTSKSYQLIFFDRNKRKIFFNVKDEAIGHQMLDAIFARAPYIFCGFSEELASATNNGRFDEMVRAVDERRSHTVNQY